jgi:hypothetical protein
MDYSKAKRSLELVLAEFRTGIAHHRAEGATEERIRQILSASIRLAVQEVHDAKLCVWLCDEFNKAASTDGNGGRYAKKRRYHPITLKPPCCVNVG